MEQPLYERVEAAKAELSEDDRTIIELLEELAVARSMDDVNIAAGHARQKLLGV